MIYKCGKEMPLAKNGETRGFCKRPINHDGRHGNRTCPDCGVIFTRRNTTFSNFQLGSGICRVCFRKRYNHKPRHWQVPRRRHIFTCGCVGILPARGRSNKFAIWVQRGYICRINAILLKSAKEARIGSHKPIDCQTPHVVIRQMMQEKKCALCHKSLMWKIGRGTTPHLHHDHSTGQLIGFTHPGCNAPIFVLELEINRLKKLNPKGKQMITLFCSSRGCTASIEINDPVSSKVKYTCREHVRKAKDKVRFQESQFDPNIGSGADPKVYEFGHRKPGPKNWKKDFDNAGGGSPKRRRLETFEQSLEGHENRDKIMQILTEDTRGGNS